MSGQRHDWKPRNCWPKWPGSIECSKCGETADAGCDFEDAEIVMRFLAEQEKRTDCRRVT